MLVDVVRLRAKGVRRPDLDVKSVPGVRGRLVLWRRFDHRRRCYVVMASLTPDGMASSDLLINQLDDARVTKLRGQDMLVTGFEEIERRKMVERYRQTWWCRVVVSRWCEDWSKD